MYFKKRKEHFPSFPRSSPMVWNNSYFQLEALKHYLDGGGNVLVMLGEGGELKYDTNINFLLEEYGIMVNSGAARHLTHFKSLVCFRCVNVNHPPPSSFSSSAPFCCCVLPQTLSWGTCTTNTSIPKRHWCLTACLIGWFGCHIDHLSIFACCTFISIAIVVRYKPTIAWKSWCEITVQSSPVICLYAALFAFSLCDVF